MSEVCGVKFELCCQNLSYGIILVMIFRPWGGSEIDFGALGGHFGAQNGHFLTSWVDFEPSWLLNCQKVGLVQMLSSPWFILGGF